MSFKAYLNNTEVKTDYSFYESIDLHLSNKQVIVYPDRDAPKTYIDYKHEDLESHIKQILNNDSKFFEDMDYAISFIWSYGNDKMLDIWKFNINYIDDRSGPLADVRIYRNMKAVSDLGAASGNTLLVLGQEEELRRKSKDLMSYLKGPAPKLPFGLQISKSFLG